MKKFIFILILLILPIHLVYAQDISINASVDRTQISLDHQLTYTVTISGATGKIPDPQLPDFAGFVAYSAGRSNNFSMINGQTSSSVTFTYVLVPTTTGTLTINPTKLTFQGRVYATDPITIEITSAQPAPAPSTPLTAPTAPIHMEEHKLFIETSLDKNECYVNEQLTLTFAFYQAIRLFETPVYTPPSTAGFWSEDMPPQNKYYTTLAGVQYLVTEIKTALFPTSPGEFVIGPAELNCTVDDIQDRSRQRHFDIFDIFRGGKPVQLKSAPMTIIVKPLPEANRPANFSGDVGSYRISGEVDKDETEVNNPITLRIKVEGEGNIKTLSEPVFSEFKDFKVYDQASSENISKADYVVQGSKVYEKILIPVTSGELEVGAIGLSYFDPKSQSYREIGTRPFTIKVTGVVPADEVIAENKINNARKKEDIKLLTEDINYIKQGVILKDEGRPLHRSAWFWFFNSLSLFLYLGSLIFTTHRRRLMEDSFYARTKTAYRGVKKRLLKAAELFNQGKSDELYVELYKAVASFIADKLNIPYGSITSGVIKEKLGAVVTDQELVTKVESYLKKCDEVRFAATRVDKQNMQADLKEAEELIVALARKLK